MEIRQLRYFKAAAENMNFSIAAESCFITQSTLSIQMQALEKELGVPLFNRRGKHIEALTEAGKILLEHAKGILQQTEKAKQAIDDLNNLLLGKVRIGVTYALSGLTLKAISRFAVLYPGIELYVEYGTSKALEKKLRNSELDIILTFHGEEQVAELQKLLLFSSPLVVAVSRSHPLAKVDHVRFSELSQYDMILPGKGFSTRNFLDHIFAHENLSVKVHMELNDVNSMLSLVRTGKWVSVLTALSLNGWEDLKGIAIDSPYSLDRNAYIIWKTMIYQDKATQLLIEQLETQSQEMLGSV